MASSNKPNRWSQQPGEGDSEYFLFTSWLARAHLPTPWRSVKREVLGFSVWAGKPYTEVQALHDAMEWTERTIAFDQSKIARDLSADLQTPEEYRIRRKRVINNALDTLEELTESVKQKVASGKMGGTPMDVARLMDSVLSFEDKFIDENQVTERGLDLGALSIAEVEELARLTAKAKRR